MHKTLDKSDAWTPLDKHKLLENYHDHAVGHFANITRDDPSHPHYDVLRAHRVAMHAHRRAIEVLKEGNKPNIEDYLADAKAKTRYANMITRQKGDPEGFYTGQITVSSLLLLERASLKPHSLLLSLRGKIAKIAQKEYNKWDEEDKDTFAGGGICHLIAEEVAGFLLGHGVECQTVSSTMEQHVYVVAQCSDGIFEVDIPYSIYEQGGGYSWTKIPNVKFGPEDVTISKLDGDPDNYRQYVDESHLELSKRISLRKTTKTFKFKGYTYIILPFTKGYTFIVHGKTQEYYSRKPAKDARQASAHAKKMIMALVKKEASKAKKSAMEKAFTDHKSHTATIHHILGKAGYRHSHQVGNGHTHRFFGRAASFNPSLYLSTALQKEGYTAKYHKIHHEGETSHHHIYSHPSGHIVHLVKTGRQGGLHAHSSIAIHHIPMNHA